MDIPEIYESEYRLCLILWANEPINSTKLVKLAKEELGWNKATTYTVIRRLSERGILKNEDTIVSSLISKEQAQEARLKQLMEDTFQGSLPAFIAAFSKNQKLSQQEADRLRSLIDGFEEE